MRFTIAVIITLILVSCRKDDSDILDGNCETFNYTYYSDYFVFIADEGTDKVVVPMDINWTPTEKGYHEEFKGWYGTQNEWPIAYHVKEIDTSSCFVPQESWHHSNSEYFQFNLVNRELILNIWNEPEIRLYIPESEFWVITPAEQNKEIYGCRTHCLVDGQTKTGWMIYERIRRIPTTSSGGGDFEAFYWLPLIINNDFYHFAQHKGQQTATKWSNSSGEVEVETIPSFDLNILAVTSDSISGRTNIPDTIQVIAEEWNIHLSVKSSGSQVGWGPPFPNGLAYYRQSLLEALDTSQTQGYGMLELILEDD